MAKYSTTITWNREGAPFTDGRYSRAHAWRFDGGLTVPASSSPHVVPVPYSDPANVDPEEAFVAALSSCHMLWFLSLAAKRGFVVDEYRDEAEGTMGYNDAGRQVMTHVLLKPHVIFSKLQVPTDADVSALHHQAHEKCYIANSVKTVVDIQGQWSFRQDRQAEPSSYD